MSPPKTTPKLDTPATLPSVEAGAFAPTRWSIVLDAANARSPTAPQALETLCETYRPAIYNYLRKLGHAHHDAEDLTQGLFARLLGRDWLKELNKENGRFRSWLLRCLNNYLINEADKQRRRPLGQALSLQAEPENEQHVPELVDTTGAHPGETIHRIWLEHLLALATAALREECALTGKLPLFEAVEPILEQPTERVDYAKLAQSLGTSADAKAKDPYVALRVAVHRLRQRYGEILRETVAQTLANPTNVDAEIRDLLTSW